MITSILNSGFGHSVRFIALVENLRKYSNEPIACLVGDSMRQFIKPNVSKYNCKVYNLHYHESLLKERSSKTTRINTVRKTQTMAKLKGTSVVINDFIPNITSLSKLFIKHPITCCLYHGDIYITEKDNNKMASFKQLITHTASKHDIFFHICLEQPQYIPDMKCTYIPIPIVSRQITTNVSTVKKMLGLKKQDKFILIHIGSAVMENVYAYLYNFYHAVNDLDIEYKIVISHSLENNNFSFHPGIIRAPLFYNGIDLVNASEMVISKPGMGILQDCITTQKPLLFVPGDFAERNLKIELLNHILSGNLPIIEKINTTTLNKSIQTCMSMTDIYTKGYSKIPTNGADILAKAIHLLSATTKDRYKEIIPQIRELSPFE